MAVGADIIVVQVYLTEPGELIHCWLNGMIDGEERILIEAGKLDSVVPVDRLRYGDFVILHYRYREKQTETKYKITQYIRPLTPVVTDESTVIEYFTPIFDQ
jgi:hypothetical protein